MENSPATQEGDLEPLPGWFVGCLAFYVLGMLALVGWAVYALALAPLVNCAPYTALDFQLLVELRISLIEGALLPISTLRIMRARGWISLPPVEAWAFVEAGDGEDDIEPTDFAVTHVRLTEVGRREIALFSERYDDAEVYGVLIEDEGVDLDDEPCDDDG